MRTWSAHAAVGLLFASSPGLASDTAVEAPIRAMLDGFNTGDVAKAKAAHVAQPIIIDEVTAPFAWSGDGAFDGWIAALGRTETAKGRTGGKVAIGAITRETVEGDRAYVLAPSTYSFQQGGRTMRETGTLTFVLTREAAGWRILSWTWSSPEAVPAS